MKIGVVSDTHGLLRPEVIPALAGVERILHLGDVGDPDILKSLEKLAPVKGLICFRRVRSPTLAAVSSNFDMVSLFKSSKYTRPR